MNILVFDTETTSLQKPFCYNIGYLIVDTESKHILVEREYVVEQVWHNPMLFTTAYYANKKELYISRMKARKITMEKFGYITQQMVRDIKAFAVEMAFAYNSPFDIGVFEFNCDWFKCINPFDNIPIKDIRGFALHSICGSTYEDFCDKHQYYTESGNYSTTAENVYRYISSPTFEEEHTALADSRIEWHILSVCLDLGADITSTYPTHNLVRERMDKLTIKLNDTEHTFEYSSRRDYRPQGSSKVNKIILKT